VRCIVRLARAASFLVAAAIAVSTSDAAAYQLRRTERGLPIRWKPGTHVRLVVSAELDETADGMGAARRAAAAWSGRGRGPRIVTSREDSRDPAYLDGRTFVAFAEPGERALGGAMAVTVLSYDESTGAILDADILVSRDHEFGHGDDDDAATRSDGTNDARQRHDLTRLLTHELGHVLGLADEPAVRDAVMFPVVANAGAGAAISRDDEAGMAALYAREVRPPTPAACAAGKIRRADALWAATATLACAALALRRAQRRQRASPTAVRQRGGGDASSRRASSG
jgi:hypothetical protein